MPELPDLTLYLEALQRRLLGERLEKVRVVSPFLVRTAVPPLDSIHGHKLLELRRIGKRIALGFEEGLWLVVHLMIAGRLHWHERADPLSRKLSAAARNQLLPGVPDRRPVAGRPQPFADPEKRLAQDGGGVGGDAPRERWRTG